MRILRVLMMLTICSTMAHANPPARFRDFKVYTTSAPDPADASRIVATMQLVSAGDELALAGEVGDGAGGLALALELDPDLILIDLNMKPMGGIDTLKALKAAGVRGRCIILTVSDDERDVLIVHLVDVQDPDSVRARHRRAHERRQRKVVP